jgi:hypothetical protein
MLNNFTKIVAGAVTVLLAGGLALGTTHHQPATTSHRQPATANNPGSDRQVTLDSASSATLIGSSVSGPATLAQDTSQFGRLPIVRVYYPGLPPTHAWSTGLAEANRSAVIVSFKADPSVILSGSDNAALKQFFDTAPTGHAIYYSYYHEPEDNIAAGQFTAAQYRQAWRVVAGIADQADNPALHSTLILMAYDLQRSSHRNWRNYLPGGHVISTLGWDAYPAGSAGSGTKKLTPPAQFMGRAVAASKSAGLPFGFAEFGTSLVTGRAAWLTSVGKYLMRSGAKFGTLFDTAAHAPSMRLTDTASINAWRGVVGRSDTANGIRHF